jgi:tRNA(Ile)-lysidine synthase
MEPLPATEPKGIIQVFSDTNEVILPDGKFEFDTVTPPEIFGKGNQIAYLNLTPGDYPLRLRHWQAGDTFQPMGMNGKSQKIQDLFSNLKLSRFEKSGVWLLETADGRICWVAGLRSDERFRVNSKNELCLKVAWIQEA